MPDNEKNECTELPSEIEAVLSKQLEALFSKKLLHMHSLSDACNAATSLVPATFEAFQVEPTQEYCMKWATKIRECLVEARGKNKRKRAANTPPSHDIAIGFSIEFGEGIEISGTEIPGLSEFLESLFGGLSD
jgi:hypothetical protein